MTIYELTNEVMELLAMAEDGDIDEQVFADTLEGLTGAIEEKADNYAKVIAQLNADADGLKKEIDRLTARKRSFEGNAHRMKQVLQWAMEQTGKTKFKTAFFSFGIQKNPASLRIDVDDLAVPEEYHIKQPDKIDHSAIKAAIKAGAEFDWCHLEQTESLRIK